MSPQHFARSDSATRKVPGSLYQFSFEFPVHFDPKFVTYSSVAEVLNFLYMYARWTEKGSQIDFVYKIIQLGFFHLCSLNVLHTLNG